MNIYKALTPWMFASMGYIYAIDGAPYWLLCLAGIITLIILYVSDYVINKENPSMHEGE